MEAPPAYLRELRDRICRAVRDVDVRQNRDRVNQKSRRLMRGASTAMHHTTCTCRKPGGGER